MNQSQMYTQSFLQSRSDSGFMSNGSLSNGIHGMTSSNSDLNIREDSGLAFSPNSFSHSNDITSPGTGSFSSLASVETDSGLSISVGLSYGSRPKGSGRQRGQATASLVTHAGPGDCDNTPAGVELHNTGQGTASVRPRFGPITGDANTELGTITVDAPPNRATMPPEPLPLAQPRVCSDVPATSLPPTQPWVCRDMPSTSLPPAQPRIWWDVPPTSLPHAQPWVCRGVPSTSVPAAQPRVWRDVPSTSLPPSQPRVCRDVPPKYMPPARFQVFVKNFDGKLYTFEVNEESSVDDLMDLIRKKIGIPTEQQRLQANGHNLNRGVKLQKYGIEEGSTIYSTGRLRGGSNVQ